MLARPPIGWNCCWPRGFRSPIEAARHEPRIGRGATSKRLLVREVRLGAWMALFRRQRAPAPELPAAVTQAQADLQALAGNRPNLAQLAKVLAEALAVIYREPLTESFPALDADRVRDLAARNAPILREIAFDLDEAAFQRRWLGIATVLMDQKDESAPALIEAARAGKFHAREWLRDVVECRPQRLLERSDELGLIPSMASVVFRWSVFPVLCKFRSMAAPNLASAPWERGFCPVCGSSPI